MMEERSHNPHQHDGLVKTDLHCHNCGNCFIAQLDFDLDGNHKIECPHCRHLHYRVIKNGIITEERFGSDNGRTYDVVKRRIWKSKDSVLQMQTSSASFFIRQAWLDKES